jgi:hypothetical protein
MTTDEIMAIADVYANESQRDGVAHMSARDETTLAARKRLRAAIEALQEEALRMAEQVHVYDKRIVALGCIAMESVHRSNLPRNCGEQFRKNHIRYQWLREHTASVGLSRFVHNSKTQFLDDAVDAAMALDKS